MTATTSTSPVTGAIAGELKKKRVLLVDTSRTKRDLRAEVMRRLGMEVDCAADIPEARAWWKADLYDLVLINVEKDGGHRDRFCEDIRSATPRQQLAFFIGKPEYLADAPGIEEDSAIVQSDDELLHYVKQTGGTVFHATCTCKMGRDMLAVVDDRLRVHGLERLRVIDASVMPAVTSTNTNAPTIMIAEKGASMIREDARLAKAA